jgi:ATP-binding cassette subfamily B protein
VRDLARSFRRFLRHRWTLTAGVLCIPLSSLGDIWITLLIGDALDRLRVGSDTAFLRGFFWLVMGVAVARGLFRFLQRWWIVCVSRYVELDLKQDLFDKLTSLSWSFHTRSRSGDVVSRLTSDVENVRMFLGPGLMYTLGALIMVPVSMAYLFAQQPWLAAGMLLPLAAMGWGMHALSPRLHRDSTAVQEALAEIGSRAQENFAGIRVVKGYGRERQQTARFDESSQKNLAHQLSLGRARGITHAITYGAKDLTFLPILLVGGWAMIERQFPAGDVFKAIDLTFKVFWPIIAVGWMAGIYPRAAASARRIEELLSTPIEIADPERPRKLGEVRGELDLEGVSFTYAGASTPALARVDLHLEAGSVLGVVGPTGAGKSTLLHLLARLFECQGTIRLDGVPIRELALAELRSALGYVPQDSFLFSDTWRANVSFGLPRLLEDAELAELTKRASMEAEVARFPNGYDQLIGERGVTLSGGQRQRTCIARALARDPRILILDDALSAVDTETETGLVASLRRAGSGRTVILAAHRLSTVRHADSILVLVNGVVQAQGTHAQLVAREGWYRDTWQRQQAQAELAAL